MPKGLVHALLLDGKGGAKHLDEAGFESWSPEAGILWAHFDITEPDATGWIRERAGIHAFAAEALLAENTRPRLIETESGTVLFLRGVNLNPGADPEDMVSIRVLVSENRVLTLRLRRLLAVQDIEAALDAGTGPKTAAGVVVRLAERLTARMEPVLAELEDRVGAFEDAVFAKDGENQKLDIGAARTEAILLRRYLKPQRDAVTALHTGTRTGFAKHQREQLTEAVDRLTRYVENLDALHERLSVLHDEYRYLQNERMNRTMYLLTVVAAILLPPSLIAGLLGANVGGMPGADKSWAFSAMVAGIAALGVLEFWLLKRLKWI